ncbi:MAG TPA: hypothetical protein VI259_10905 [Gemmatimonadaceae bacterium]
MTLVERIGRAFATGVQPTVYCPLCRHPKVRLLVCAGSVAHDPALVLDIHDIPVHEVVFDIPGGAAHVAVRCPASSQPVTEVP